METVMRDNTVIGTFDNADLARRAVQRLESEGIHAGDIRTHHRDEHVPAANEGMTEGTWEGMEREVAVGRHVLGSLGRAFASLFGHDDGRDRAGIYAEGVHRGHCVVVVEARNDIEATRAADVMRACGAFDMEQRAQEWKAAGWSASPAHLDRKGMDRELDRMTAERSEREREERAFAAQQREDMARRDKPNR
jgi:hypothetical protein